MKVWGFESLHPERMLALLAIMSILVVLSAAWLGRFYVAFEKSELCANGVIACIDETR